MHVQDDEQVLKLVNEDVRPDAPDSTARVDRGPGNCYSGPPISAKTFEGSFSAVWVATIATKYSFCSVFRDLPETLLESVSKPQNFDNTFAPIFAD